MEKEPRQEIYPYYGWTDKQRMDKFAQTGFGGCLTLDLAHRIKVGSKTMQEVPGATKEDVDLAHEYDNQFDKQNEVATIQEMFDTYASQNGSQWQELSKEDQLYFFLSIIAKPYEPKGSLGDEKYSDLRNAKETAEAEVIKLLNQNIETYLPLFLEKLNPNSLDTLTYVSILYDYALSVQQKCAELLKTHDSSPSETNTAGSETKYEAELQKLSTLKQLCLDKNKQLEEEKTNSENLYLPLHAADIATFRVFANAYDLRETLLYRDRIFVLTSSLSAVRSSIDGQLFIINTTEIPKTGEEEQQEYVLDNGIAITTLLDDVKYSSEYIRDLVLLHEPEISDLIENDFGVDVTQLNLQEQFYFLNYLKGIRVAGVKTMKDFIIRYDVAGMRTFHSLEREGINGEKIVSFGIKSENATEIFKYYSQLLDKADEAETIVKQECINNDDIQITMGSIVAEVRQLILERAHRALIQAVSEGKETDVLEIIETANSDSIGISESYLALKKAGLVKTIEDMQSIEKVQYSGEELLARPDVIEQVATLFHERWSPDDANIRLTSLQEHLKEPNTTLTVEWLHERVIATLFTEERNDNSVYIGSLNATGDQYLQSLKIGSSLVGPVIEQYATAGKKLEATSLLSTATSYINIYGFVAVERLEDNPSTGEQRVLLLRDNTWPLVSKNMKRDELIFLINESNNVGEKPVMVRPVEYETELPPELTQGYVLTRQIRYKGKKYNVLEQFSVPETTEFV